MTKTLKINKSTSIPTDTIRFIRPVGDEERARIEERYGKDASDFNVSIQFADKSSKLAVQTLDEIRQQGVALVNIGADRHVVAANIKSAEPFGKQDAAKAKENGYELSQTFRSRVETTAGAVLSSATPAQVLERRAKAMDAAAPQPAAK